MEYDQLQEDVNRLKRMEQVAKNELYALQNKVNEEVEPKETKKGNFEEE